jgi:hypothetical protein
VGGPTTAIVLTGVVEKIYERNAGMHAVNQSMPGIYPRGSSLISQKWKDVWRSIRTEQLWPRKGCMALGRAVVHIGLLRRFRGKNEKHMLPRKQIDAPRTLVPDQLFLGKVLRPGLGPLDWIVNCSTAMCSLIGRMRGKMKMGKRKSRWACVVGGRPLHWETPTRPLATRRGGARTRLAGRPFLSRKT